MSYTHALRAGELIDLRWSDIDLKNGTLHVRRLKGSCNGTHYLAAEEIRLLRKLNVRPDGFVFESERGGPLTLRAVHKIVAQAGRVAEIPFPIHPHMLRHSKGYQLANKGTDTRLLQTYLGHKDIRSTTLYTQLDPSRVRGLEKNDL